MKIVTIKMIIEVNKLLKELGIDYKVHLRDSCTKQAMWLECIKKESETQSTDEKYLVINEYFEKSGMNLEYSEDRMSFWVGDKKSFDI